MTLALTLVLTLTLTVCMYRAGEHDEKMDAATAKKEADMSKKTSVKMGPWDVCKKVYSIQLSF